MTEQKLELTSKKEERLINPDEQNTPAITSLRYIIVWGVILGLLMNWMGTYLRISMGFVGVGIGPMAVLLIARAIFKRKGLSNRRNLAVVIISYGATQAAEASVSILFLLWLYANQSFFGLSFNPPWWLLPSPEVLNSRGIFSAEWLVPLGVHYFLMLVPGILGLALGWGMKNSFIDDDEKYPFPTVISQNSQLGVLSDESETKGPIFWKFARYGFVFALITTLVPGLMVIDLSNTGVGFIIGLFLGPVGLALLAAGILIGNTKISIGAAGSSVLAYSVLGIFLVGGKPELDYYELFTFLLQDHFFVPALGLLLGGLVIGPLFWGIVKPLFKKKENKDADEEQLEKKETIEEIMEKPSKLKLMQLVVRKHWKMLGLFSTVYVLMVLYVQTLDLIPAAPLWVIAALVFWMTIMGGVVNGYLVTVGLARANTAITPPFIFDSAAIYAVGGAGYIPYVAMPIAETDGSAGIVSSQKLAKMNGISSRVGLIAYLSGYLATTVTTPLFALLMWRSFGIGTPSFPAPAFPVQGAILASFASRDVTSFIDIQILLIVLAIGVLIAGFKPDLAMGIGIGILFPPHMGLMMGIGGIVRVLMDRRYGKEQGKDKSSTIAPGMAVGASFVIPIMIIMALVL